MLLNIFPLLSPSIATDTFQTGSNRVAFTATTQQNPLLFHFYPLSAVSGVFCYRLVIFLLHSHSHICFSFSWDISKLEGCAIECCADISLMDTSPPPPTPLILSPDLLLRQEPKRQKILPNYFKHPTCQFERHFPS